MMALMVAILNIFASSLVYVRILPLDKQVDKVGSSGEKTQIKGTDTKFDKSKAYFTFIDIKSMLLTGSHNQSRNYTNPNFHEYLTAS